MKRVVVDDAPGPSPWYLRTGKPWIRGFEWRAAGESSQTAGATVLSGDRGPLLLLDFHNYVLPVDENTILLWHQGGRETGPTTPVRLTIFRLSDLVPFDSDLEELCESMRRTKASFVAAAAPLCEHDIPTTIAGRRIRHDFPDPIRHIHEILILCQSSGVEESPPPERSNLALLVVRPAEGTYELFPQDWFNSARLDYSYQWVTRVARDSQSGRIHGDGIRIDPFVLDETLRNTVPGAGRRRLLLLASVFFALPVMFGLARAVFASDVRYLWLAVPAILGSMSLVQASSARMSLRRALAAVAAGAIPTAAIAIIIGAPTGSEVAALAIAYGICTGIGAAFARLSRSGGTPN